jgi:hypothetical protein
MDQILGYQGAPYAPDYQPSLDEQLASMPIALAPQVLGSVATPPEGPGVSFTPILGGSQYSAAPPVSSAAAPGLLYTPAPNASFMPMSAPTGAPTAAPPPAVAPTAAPPPAAPPRGAQAPRAAGPAKLSEIGQIQTGLAKQQEQAASEFYDIEARRVEAEGATTEAAQKAERVTSALRIQAADDRAAEVREREEDATIEREARRQAAEDSTKKLSAAQGELENTKLDIDAAYGGAAGRIFSGLAVALGSFGASMTGGPNYALQIVNDRISRELDAQKSEIDKKKGKVTELGRILQQNENLLGDATDARKLAQAQTYLALASQAEAQTKGRELGPQQQAVVDKLKTQAETTFRELQTNVEGRAANTLMIAAQERQAQRVAAAAAAAKERERVRALTEKKADQEFELTKIVVKGGVDQQTAGATAGKEMIGRTTDMGKALQADGVVFTAELYQRLAKNLGMDPATGKATGEAPGVGWANMGAITDTGAQNKKDLKQFVEMSAKAAGGPITESDRNSADDLIRGIGTTDAIRRGVFSVGQRLSANIRTRAASDPAAMATLQGQIPILKTMQNIGQQDAAVAAGGFSKAPPPPAK